MMRTDVQAEPADRASLQDTNCVEKCTACGTDFASDAAFCKRCGRRRPIAATGVNHSAQQLSASKLEGLQTCRWFLQGTCKFGSQCRLLHPNSAMRSAGGRAMSHGGRATRRNTVPVAPTLSGPTPRQISRGRAAVSKARPGVPRRDLLQSSLDESCDDDSADEHPRSVSPASTAARSTTAEGSRSPAEVPIRRRQDCRIVWCDQRAFKAEASAMRAELESATQLQAKAHKNAEKCIRVLQKKRALQSKVKAGPVNVFIVSWANTPALVAYLSDSPHITAHVIVLCDTCKGRGLNNAETWARGHPQVSQVVATWHQAVAAAAEAAASAALVAKSNTAHGGTVSHSMTT